MRYKKSFCIFFVYFIFGKAFSLSFDKLIELTLQNNTDILSAQNSYDSACLSLKTLSGAYAPQVSLASSASLPDEYKWDTSPDYFSSSITYSQPLPGGTTLGFTGSFSFNSAEFLEERYISQNPSLSFSLTQSLFPFWAQGKIKNPAKLSAKQQKDYYYNQLLYTKKTVLQNLLQNYIYAAVYKKQIQIYENSIYLLDKQIEISNQLLKTGAVNQARITELQSSKWSYQQDLMSAKSSYISYIQNLKTICGTAFENDSLSLENKTLPKLDDFTKGILLITDNIVDPLEESYKLKIELLKTNHTLEKQFSAPTLSISVQPLWSLDPKKQEEWKEAWKDANSPSSWSATIGVNLSPLLSVAVSKKEQQYELNYQAAENSLNAYITQKTFVLQQYKTILENYKTQLEEISNLYNAGRAELKDIESLFTAGSISELDFDSVKVRVENCRLNMEIIELYVWLYEVLCNINL